MYSFEELQQTEMGPQSFLRDWIHAYLGEHPKQSLRELSRRAKVNVSTLSEVLSGKREPTRQMLLRMATVTGAPMDDVRSALLSWDISRCRDPEMRQQLTQLLNSKEAQDQDALGVRELSEAEFETISEWHYLVILEWLSIDPLLTPKKLSYLIGISEWTCRSSIERLLQIGLLATSPLGLKRTERGLEISSNRGLMAAQLHNQSHLQRMSEALVKMDPRARRMDATTIAIPSSLREEIFNRLSDFHDSLRSFIATSTGERDEVVQIGQFAYVHSPDLQGEPIEHQNRFQKKEKI